MLYLLHMPLLLIYFKLGFYSEHMFLHYAWLSNCWCQCGLLVLDFVQEKFHNTSPGDFESMFIKAGDSETKEGLKIKEARSQQQE